ncbi:MAG: Ig-like domain-containing protein, partial [Treponema sp.]|nr:Ig-like domain-containing protein [Treponema sp.]
MKKFRIFALILISLALVLACGTGTGGSGANGETPPNGQTPQLPVAVNGVDIDRASPINIPTNSSISITATVRPLDATNKAVSWSIESGANRISFQSPTTTGTTNTIVSGNSTGEATIKVTTADGSFTAERVVRVIPAVPPTSITTEPPAGGLLPLVLGTATGLVRVTGMSPENADSRVRFTSQNENVVTVHEETGVVTAVNLGHTTITVRSFLPASTATSVVNVQVTAPTGGVPPDHLYVWRVDDDGDLVALIDAKTPTAELPWNDPDKDGSYDKPFNVGPIGHGQYIDLVFEASGPSGSNRNLVPHTWSIFGVLENIQPTSVRLRGINNTDDVQKDVMFSISSAVDPNMRVFVKFDVSPASKLADFKVLEAE